MAAEMCNSSLEEKSSPFMYKLRRWPHCITFTKRRTSLESRVRMEDGIHKSSNDIFFTTSTVTHRSEVREVRSEGFKVGIPDGRALNYTVFIYG